jgi:hypothetical protein
MKYVYDRDLEIQHIGLGDRLANYFHKKESVILVREEDYQYARGRCWAVASFDKYGFCNNAQTFDNEDKAWDFFYEIMKDIRKPLSQQGEPDGHVCDGTDADDEDDGG